MNLLRHNPVRTGHIVDVDAQRAQTVLIDDLQAFFVDENDHSTVFPGLAPQLASSQERIAGSVPVHVLRGGGHNTCTGRYAKGWWGLVVVAFRKFLSFGSSVIDRSFERRFRFQSSSFKVQNIFRVFLLFLALLLGVKQSSFFFGQAHNFRFSFGW